MLTKQLSVFVENKPGRLAEITQIIASHNINIRALSIADTTDYGILRIITDNADIAHETLTGCGLTVLVSEVLTVRMPDRPGGLSEVLSLLASHGHSVEYIYAYTSSERPGEAVVVLRTEKATEARDVLISAGYLGA